MRTRDLFATIGMAAVVMMAPVMASAQTQTFTLNIPTGSTKSALLAVSRATHQEIIFDSALVRNSKSEALKGEFTTEAAIAKLLEGSGLVVSRSQNGVWRITKPQAVPVSGGIDEEPTQIIVTGTNIRNANPTSPVHIVTRKDIELSGYSQVGELMRSLPEDSGAGQNPGIVNGSTSSLGNQNISGASTVNLHGLGTDATLVLLNGHRLGADGFFQGQDISAIPLAAIQRVEVMTDGASALYGSDAVAGVVNFIMRKDLNGGEASVRVGTATEGGGTEQTVNLLQGWSGKNGYLLANLQYSRLEPVMAGDRDYLAAVYPRRSLTPFQENRSLFVDAGKQLTDRIGIEVQGLLSDRRSISEFSNGSPDYIAPVFTPAYNVSASVDAKLGGDWTLKATAGASGSYNNYNTLNRATGISVGPTRYENDARTFEVKADGTLFHLPSGDVKGAFGVGYNEEGYAQGYKTRSSYLQASRNDTYGFAEILAPLVTPDTSRAGLHELEVSLSGRAERYSDLGSSTTPKIGLRYVPFDTLTLHATWGKSFKAPSLLQMHQKGQIILYPVTAIGGTGSGTAILTYGGNPNLNPEKSTSWTFGGDYKPTWLPSSVFSATYFDIDYKDRVVQPLAITAQALSNPDYVPFIDYDPSVADQNAAIALGTFYNLTSGAYDPSNVVAIANDLYTNATSQTIKGVDLAYKQSLVFTWGTLSTFANATWTQLKQQTIVTLPETTLSGSLFNVPKFKARGGVSWQSGALTAAGFVNYTAGERDTNVTPNGDIASFTTVDATFSYVLGDRSDPAKAVKLILAASNLFDKAPPMITPMAAYLYNYPRYDSANASAVGRFVSLTVKKGW